MSLRDTMPKARLSDSHYFLTFARGESLRCFAIRPWALFTLIGCLPLVLAVYLGATLYLVYRDDMLAGLMSRQTEMQYAYEDRLASMRAQIDRVTGRQLLDQNTLEGRVHELLSRQAQIETRSSVIAALARQANISAPADSTASIAKPLDARAAINRGINLPATPPRKAGVALPSGVSAFAPPTAAPPPAPVGDKPRPENEQQSAIEPPRNELLELANNPDIPVETRLRTLSSSLGQVEVRQVSQIDAIGAAARRSATRLRAAMQDAGLPVERLIAASAAAKSGMGGPFVPLKVDPNGSLFEREVFRLQNDFLAADQLSRAIRRAPLRKPLSGSLEITSPFGARVDPFFGRMATHTGVDLREMTGAPARATAAGKVISAGWNGGYGNMVEIDHGAGLTTRYAHLSAILVSEGQMVDAREIIGKVGSTGRSTGSHLHYEVRIDDVPVDPMRFLRASDRLAAND